MLKCRSWWPPVLDVAIGSTGEDVGAACHSAPSEVGVPVGNARHALPGKSGSAEQLRQAPPRAFSPYRQQPAGAGWWVDPAKVKQHAGAGAAPRACRDLQHVCAAVPAPGAPTPLNDMGPPTPDSEDRTYSLAAIDAVLPSILRPRRQLQVDKQQPGHGSACSLHVLYLGLFLESDAQDSLLQRMRPQHESVSADHVTLHYKPGTAALDGLPLGTAFDVLASGVVSDDKTQGVMIQLPGPMLHHFAGRVPHLTVSWAGGANAKAAGDLVADVCAGEADESSVSTEVWQEPLVLPCRLGAMLSDGRCLYSAQALSSALQSSWREHTSDETQGLSTGSKEPALASLPPAAAQPRPAAARAQAPWRLFHDAVRQTAGAQDARDNDQLLPGLDNVADEESLIFVELDELLAGLEASAKPGQAAATGSQRVNPGKKQLPAAGPPTFIGQPANHHHAQAKHRTGNSKHKCKEQRRAALQPAFIRQRGKGLPAGMRASEREAQEGTPQPSAVTASSDERSSADSAEEGPRRKLFDSQQGGAAKAADRQGACEAGPVVVGTPDQAPAASDARTPPAAGQAEAPASRAHEAPLPRKAHAAVLAASRLTRGTDSRSFVDVWREAGGLREQSSSGASQPAVAVGGHGAQPGATEGKGDAEQPGSVGPDLPAILMQHFPGLDLAMAEYVLQRCGGEAVEAARFLEEAMCADSGEEQKAPPAPQPLQFAAHAGPAVASAAARPQQQAVPASSAVQTSGFWTGAAAATWACQRERDGLGPATAVQGSTSAAAAGQPAAGQGSPAQLACHSAQLLAVQQRGGTVAAVAAAQAAAARALAERAEAKRLADAERRAIGLHWHARDVFSAAAADAHQQGDRELAQELAYKCKEHDQLATEARGRANAVAFDGFNRSLLNRWKVDLHGLHVEEALRVLEKHLIALGGLGHPGGILLQVVTGVGKHSVGGVPRILPAVVRYLTEAGFNFSEEPNNPGLICVHLPGRRDAAAV